MSDIESDGVIEDFDSASFPSDMDDTELCVFSSCSRLHLWSQMMTVFMSVKLTEMFLIDPCSRL